RLQVTFCPSQCRFHRTAAADDLRDLPGGSPFSGEESPQAGKVLSARQPQRLDDGRRHTAIAQVRRVIFSGSANAMHEIGGAVGDTQRHTVHESKTFYIAYLSWL